MYYNFAATDTMTSYWSCWFYLPSDCVFGVGKLSGCCGVER